MPTFSVITPVYNGEKFVNRCYRNLLDQTYTDWEWVVINDGSTDGTLDELRKISDARLRLITYSKNMGRGYARQRAIEACQGDWMVVLDVDDFNFPDRLEMMNAARTQGYDFFCSYSVVCTNQFHIKGIRGFSLSSHGLPNTFVYATMACRLDIAIKIGYDSTIRTGEDTETVWILPSNYNGMWCKKALYVYQEDREVNLQKAIECNYTQFKLLRKLFRQNALLLTPLNYFYHICRYCIKLLLLHILKLKPELYLRSVKHRSYGVVNNEYNLSEDQLSYIDIMKHNL